MAHGNRCSSASKDEAAVQALAEKYRAQGVQTFLIDSNLTDSRDAVGQAMDQAKIGLPVLLDETQLIGESLALAKNGEVLVIDPQGWKLAYRGSAKEAGAALDAVLGGSPVKTA